MGDLEQVIDQLCPGNVYTQEGARGVVDAIFDFLGHPKIFGIKEEIFEEAVMRFPPLNIMIPVSYTHLDVYKRQAYDGDADRLGVVDDQGNVVWGDKLMCLFWREILAKHPEELAIVEVKCRCV